MKTGLHPLAAVIAAGVLALTAAMALALTADPASASTKPTIHVSPSGKDGSDATARKPLRTLTAARNRARRLMAAGAPGATIVLHDGTFRVKRALRLDARDSGRGGSMVSYQAAHGASPVISGAIQAKNFKLVDPALNIYMAQVPKGTQSRQLYVNGRRALRARSGENPDGFWRTDAGYQAPDASMSTWRRPSDLEFVTMTQWKMMSCPVAGVTGNQVTMQQPCWTNVNVFPYLWSFQLISHFENAYELLDQAGEWYLDGPNGALYYIPRAGENIAKVDAELPVAERLIDGVGTPTKPVRNIRFSGITFEHATWLDPSSANGYAADQSGYHLIGGGHAPNVIGHDQNAVRTPGNVSFRYASNIRFTRNTFARLGGVALDFDTGSQSSRVVGNRFDDISSAAVQVGGISPADHHPPSPAQLSRDNTISNNLIRRTGREFVDSAAVMIGFTTRSKIANNEISNVPWSGIALGWGWGLLDPGGYLGLPGAVQGGWGNYTTPTASLGNRIEYNKISRYLMKLWDGGGIYTVGQQGTSAANGTLIRGNVITGKRRLAGGNTIYTDGGSRYVNIEQNVLFDNPPGITDFGPCGLTDSLLFCFVLAPYGTDRGGCRTYGDINYFENYWQHPTPFFDICPYEGHPVNVVDNGNVVITGRQGVSRSVLGLAGRQGSYRKKVGAR